VRVSAWLRGPLIATLILSVAACGGGGSSGGGGSGATGPSVTGNGLAPSSGPGDASLSFPAAQGDKWSFDYATNDPNAVSTSGIVGVAVNGTRSVQGVTGTVFTRSDPTNSHGGYDQYFYVNGGGVTLLGNSDPTDTITPLIAPYVELLFPVQLGPVSTVMGANLPFGKDSGGNAITLNLTQTITNAAIESVDVPAGPFPNAMRQTTSVSATAFDNGHSTPTVSGTQTIWLVAGAGEVREQSSVTGTAAPVTSTSELRNYVVNGVQHGLGAAADLIPSLVAGCGPNQTARPAIATDHTNFLVVAHKCNTSGGAPQVQWVGTVVGPDGSVKASVNLSPAVTPAAGVMIGLHAVVAFDGTNYLVVHEDDNNPTPGIAALDAQLVAPSGALVGSPTVVGQAAYNTNRLSEAEALAFDGSRYLLVYVDNTAVIRPPQLSGLYISPATGQPAGVPFPISNTNDYDHAEPALAFDGTNYLLVWVESGSSPPGLSAVRVSKLGTVLDAQPLLIMNNTGGASGYDLEPTVSFDGTNYLVAYKDIRGGGGPKIAAARVSIAGALLDGSATVPGIAVTTTAAATIGRLRSAFYEGAHWLVWDAGSSTVLNASRVSTAGTVPAAWPNGFVLTAPEQSTESWPAIAASAGGALVGWVDGVASAAGPITLRAMPIFPVP
jgi:hypothetical protein